MSGEPLARSLAATVHGTYLLAPPAGGGAPELLVVGFHGYGEAAADHLAALRRIPGADRWLLCAVQALHPFYRRSGGVVASWMTSHGREHAIVDNVAYVAAAVAAVRAEFPAAGPLAYAGFSQGVAMAYRAAAGAGHPATALIALAGDVPPEVAARDDLAAVLPPVLIGAGSTDGWYGPDRLERDRTLLAAQGVAVEGLVFIGGHEWTEGFLARAGAFLTERVSAS
jgi:predicted esterase